MCCRVANERVREADEFEEEGERGRKGSRASSRVRKREREREGGVSSTHITELNQLLSHRRVPNHQHRLPLHPLYILSFVSPARISHLLRLLAALSQPIPHGPEQLGRLAFRVERVVAVVFRYQRIYVEVTEGVIRIAGRT